MYIWYPWYLIIHGIKSMSLSDFKISSSTLQLFIVLLFTKLLFCFSEIWILQDKPIRNSLYLSWHYYAAKRNLPTTCTIKVDTDHSCEVWLKSHQRLDLWKPDNILLFVAQATILCSEAKLACDMHKNRVRTGHSCETFGRNTTICLIFERGQGTPIFSSGGRLVQRIRTCLLHAKLGLFFFLSCEVWTESHQQFDLWKPDKFVVNGRQN